MTTRTSTHSTRKIVDLTPEERVSLGVQEYVNFKKNLEEQADSEINTREAVEELDLWTQIYQMREAAGLTQIDLAKRLGLSQSQIAKLESSTHGGYTVDTLRKLAHATDHRMTITFEPRR